MSWLDKDMQIAILSLVDAQKQAYEHFLVVYDKETALKQTKIFMDAFAIMMKPSNSAPPC